MSDTSWGPSPTKATWLRFSSCLLNQPTKAAPRLRLDLRANDWRVAAWHQYAETHHTLTASQQAIVVNAHVQRGGIDKEPAVGEVWLSAPAVSFHSQQEPSLDIEATGAARPPGANSNDSSVLLGETNAP